MKILKKRRVQRIPEEFSEPMGRNEPMWKFFEHIGDVVEWAGEDRTITTKEAEDYGQEWCNVATFLAFNLLPLFMRLKEDKASKSGAPKKDAHADELIKLVDQQMIKSKSISAACNKLIERKVLPERFLYVSSGRIARLYTDAKRARGISKGKSTNRKKP